jgi:hypothetical protein
MAERLSALRAVNPLPQEDSCYWFLLEAESTRNERISWPLPVVEAWFLSGLVDKSVTKSTELSRLHKRTKTIFWIFKAIKKIASLVSNLWKSCIRCVLGAHGCDELKVKLFGNVWQAFQLPSSELITVGMISAAARLLEVKPRFDEAKDFVMREVQKYYQAPWKAINSE